MKRNYPLTFKVWWVKRTNLATQQEKDAAIASAQAALEAANALVVETGSTVAEVDVKESDGTEQKFVPETPAA